MSCWVSEPEGGGRQLRGPLNSLALSRGMFFSLFMVPDRVVFVLGRAGLRKQAAEKAVGLHFPLGLSPRPSQRAVI